MYVHVIEVYKYFIFRSVQVFTPQKNTNRSNFHFREISDLEAPVQRANYPLEAGEDLFLASKEGTSNFTLSLSLASSLRIHIVSLTAWLLSRYFCSPDANVHAPF